MISAGDASSFPVPSDDEEQLWVMGISTAVFTSDLFDHPCVGGIGKVDGDGYTWVSIDSGSDADCCPASFGSSSGDVKDAPVIALSTATDGKIDSYGQRLVGYTIDDEMGASIDAVNQFQVGNLAKPVLSAGLRIRRGAIIHFENGNSYISPPARPNYLRRQFPLTMLNNSFYLRVKVQSRAVDRHLSSTTRVMDIQDVTDEAAVVVDEPEPQDPELPPLVPIPPAWVRPPPTVLSAESGKDAIVKRLKELNAPIYGTKKELYERLIEREAKARLQADERLRLEVRQEELRSGAVPATPLSPSVPEKPGVEEVKAHELTHMPFAAWCPACVMGRGRAMAHGWKDLESHDAKPSKVQIDFHYLDSDLKADSTKKPWATTLQVADEATGVPLQLAVPSKSPEIEYTSRSVVEFLKRLGHTRITLKFDGEPAMVELASRIKVLRMNLYKQDTVLEQAPCYSSQTMGAVGAAQRTCLA